MSPPIRSLPPSVTSALRYFHPPLLPSPLLPPFIHPPDLHHSPSPSPEPGRRLSFASSAVGGWAGRVARRPLSCGFVARNLSRARHRAATIDAASGDAAAPSLIRRSVASPILPRLRSCDSGLFWVSCAFLVSSVGSPASTVAPAPPELPPPPPSLPHRLSNLLPPRLSLAAY